MAEAREKSPIERKADEIAGELAGLPLQRKIDIIAQTFGARTGRIRATRCRGKWRGTHDLSIVFDDGRSLFIGNESAAAPSGGRRMVDESLRRHNPAIVRATKEAALAGLREMEARDNAVAAERGLKPYKLLSVELADGTEEDGRFIGWYYAVLAIGGKVRRHIETHLAYGILEDRLEHWMGRGGFGAAGGLRDSEVDYVFGDTGFSSTSELYTFGMSAESKRA